MAWCLLRREPISAVTLPQARNCTIRRLAVGVSPAALTPHASCIARRCWPTAWCLPWEDLIAILTCPQVQNCTTLLHLRSEEHTSELQSQSNLVCRLLLEK